MENKVLLLSKKLQVARCGLLTTCLDLIRLMTLFVFSTVTFLILSHSHSYTPLSLLILNLKPFLVLPPSC